VFANSVFETVTVVTATSGAVELTGTIAGVTVNEFQGGYVTFDGTIDTYMGIVSNTATDDPASGQAKFILDGALPCVYTSSNTVEVVTGPYHDVVTSNGTRASTAKDFEACVGFLNSPQDADGTAMADGDYCWVQTWGPCHCWASVAYEGGSTLEREAFVLADGAVQVNTASDSYPSAQRVGFLYPCTQTTAGIGGTGTNVTRMQHIIFLQIAP